MKNVVKVTHGPFIVTMALVTALLGVPVFAQTIVAAPGTVADAGEGVVEVDYAVQVASGHPEVFGLSTWPLNNNPAFAKLLADCGVTIMRTDLNLRLHIVPKTTIADYKANVGNVRDSDKWDWSVYDRFLDAYQDVGIRHLLIMFAVPDWLACNPKPKTAETSIPKDWEVYGDIVQKVFQHYRKRAAYFEIWNEPNLVEFSFDLTGSPFTVDIEAYKDLYRRDVTAIRQIDKAMPIGGPATAGPRPDWLANILKDDFIRRDIAFASWHEYTDKPVSDSGLASMRKAGADGGLPKLPMFITEWNADNKSLAATSPEAVSYAAARLTSYLNAGMDGAFMYCGDEKFSPEYAIIKADGTLTAKASAYRLLSRKLGLGLSKGDSRIVSTRTKGVTIASAAVNSDGEKVLWIVNDEKAPRTVSVTIRNAGRAKSASLSHYLASATDTAYEPLRIDDSVPITDGSLALRLTLPPKSVHGVVLSELPGCACRLVVRSRWSRIATGADVK